MKENKKQAVILTEDTGQNAESSGYDDKKKFSERAVKPLIFALMGVVFIGCMVLIFRPSPQDELKENPGINDSVPQPAQAVLQADKQKAYEQEVLQDKEDKKRDALNSLSDYWNEGSGADDQQEGVPEEETGSSHRQGNPAVNSYRNAQSTLGSFYQDENAETRQLKKELEQIKDRLAQKEVPAAVTVDDQLALMEKSYQLAAKYLPSGTIAAGADKNSSLAPAAAGNKAPYFAPFVPEIKSGVSSLYRETADSAFSAGRYKGSNSGFYTAGCQQEALQPKNSVRACVQETQTITSEGSVRLRLLEHAQLPGHIIASGTILTAAAKIQAGRLQLKVTSIELDGSIIPVDITIYDIDGQQGLSMPYSAEMNALTEMAGNMSQQSGTSLMLTQSAGQQMAADLSRGVVQGISGYFSKKIKTPKVTLKSGHQVFLVSKK
ncbi:conjugative transposon protein TraM [Flavobacterium notoginsengisoli]|uniref:conjugative transposon protein TraM n=1 Tax=Flavobacterium notoginsengisoli TaxID=1478199 RepID=UPI003642FC4E